MCVEEKSEKFAYFLWRSIFYECVLNFCHSKNEFI